MATNVAMDKLNTPGPDTGSDISPDGIPVNNSLPFDDKHGPAPTAPVAEREVEVKEDNTPAEVVDDTTKEIEDKPIDFSDFLKNKNIEEDIPTPKAVKKEVEDEPIVAHKPRKELVADDIKTRDITDIDPDLAPHLQKEMSRKAFDKVVPIIKEHKALKTKVAEQEKLLAESSKSSLPANYLAHPDAFVLSKDFEVATRRTNLAQEISNHWKSQASKIRKGAAEVEVINFDPSGKLVISGKIPVGDDTEESVLEQFNIAQDQLIKERSKLETLATTHRERHTKAKQSLDVFENTAFSHFNTDEGKKLMPVINSIIEGFDPAFRNDPLMPTLAKSLFINQQLKNYIDSLVSGKSALPKVKGVATKPSAQRKAGPTADDTGSDNSGSKSPGDISFADFEAAKGGY